MKSGSDKDPGRRRLQRPFPILIELEVKDKGEISKGTRNDKMTSLMMKNGKCAAGRQSPRVGLYMSRKKLGVKFHLPSDILSFPPRSNKTGKRKSFEAGAWCGLKMVARK